MSTQPVVGTNADLAVCMRVASAAVAALCAASAWVRRSRDTQCSGLSPSPSSPVQVAPAIKERMMKKGSLMLGYQPHQGKVNFFRQVVISPQVSREDMDFLLDEIDLLGKDM